MTGGGEVRIGTRFYRAHGLGNDYLVFEAAESGEPGWPSTVPAIRAVCDRHEGVGGDGIVLLLDRTPADGVFPLRMFNPDGSEFERSGNGLRVLASYLAREGLAGRSPFTVRSGGAEIGMTVHASTEAGEHDVSVEMGRARLGLEAVGADPGRLGGSAEDVAGQAHGGAEHPSRGIVSFVAVSVGNPHAVIFPAEPATDELLAELGPFLAENPGFRAGTNVQLVEVRSPDRIRIRIWERGVGRTSASGTSSCASAVAALASGRIEPGRVMVEMDGGALEVTLTPEMDVRLRGSVSEVAEGRLTAGFAAGLDPG